MARPKGHGQGPNSRSPSGYQGKQDLADYRAHALDLVILSAPLQPGQWGTETEVPELRNASNFPNR